MKLLSLSYERFRNLREVRLTPSAHATIAVGENGQGKTNLLEAVYLLSTLRPLRAARLAELVRFGASRALVAGGFDGPGGLRRVAVEVAGGNRAAFLDGKPVAGGTGLGDYFEGLSAVCFSPDDLLLVKGSPEGRRRFVDRAAFNRWPAVLGEAPLAQQFVRLLSYEGTTADFAVAVYKRVGNSYSSIEGTPFFRIDKNFSVGGQ